MKTIRNFLTLTGLSLALLALGAVGAEAQQARSLSTTVIGGSFTLPFEVQWGAVTLPAGDYTVSYGSMSSGGPYLVEVVGKAKGSPHALILASGENHNAATKSSLICIREGNTGIVRALQLSAIGETVFFAMPHGGKLMAHEQHNGKNTLLAEAPMLIQRVPVTLNGK